MIGSADHHDRAEPVLVAPPGKNPAFIRGSNDSSRDLLDGLDAERHELSNGSYGYVLVGDPSADELAVHGVRRIGKDCDSRGYTGLNEVGGFEHSGAVGITRHDDDVCWFDGVIDYESPPSGSENLPSKRHSGSCAQHHNRQQNSKPSSSRKHRIRRYMG